jgi:hypothetical protein
MAPQLEKAFTARANIEKESTVMVGPVSAGLVRVIARVKSGFIRGEGFEAEMLPGSGDWMLVSFEITQPANAAPSFWKGSKPNSLIQPHQLDTNAGIAHIDCRLQAPMANGHFIYMHYKSPLPLTEKSSKALQWAPDAVSIPYGEIAFFPTPSLETSDPDLKWVEKSTFVGEGTVSQIDGRPIFIRPVLSLVPIAVR